MPETNVDTTQLEAFLRAEGLIPPDYSGEVVISATTSEGSDNLTFTV